MIPRVNNKATSGAMPSNTWNNLSGLSQGPHIIQSFDIFDTLIARKCGDATNIFRIVELKHKAQGFTKLRIKAEKYLCELGTEFNFDDIYKLIQENLKISDNELEILKKSELSTEIENAIPIECNIEKVTRDSILITDMYHSEEFIRILLYKVGIEYELPIIQTSFGKSKGYVWEELVKNGIQCRHLGDSAHSDVKMSRKYGMISEYSTVSKPNLIEDKLSANKLYKLACCFREARLKNFLAPEEYLCESYALQNLVNIPLMLYFSAYIIKKFIITREKHKLLFSSRDCRLLHHATRMILSKLVSETECVKTRYWLTSRQSRVYGSDTYLEYCEELAKGEGCLFVDLVGTGASMHILCGRLNQNKSKSYTSNDFFLAQSYGIAGINGGQTSAKDELYRRYDVKNERMISSQGSIEFALSCEKTIDSLYLEMMNYTPEGMLRDVVNIQNSYIPWRDQCDLDDFQKNLAVKTQSYSLKCINTILESYEGTMESFLDSVLSDKYIEIISHICKEARPSLEYFVKKHFIGAHVSNEDFIDIHNSLNTPQKG